MAVDGTLLSFAATFVQHCDGATPALYGEVRYRSTVGWPGKEISPTTFESYVATGNVVSGGLTIQNTGTAPLSLSSFTVNPNPSSFSVTGGTCLSGPVAPSSSCSVIITTDATRMFTPTATLTFLDNTARGTGSIPLTATAVPPAASLSSTPQIQVSTSAAGAGDPTSCGSIPCVEPPDPWMAVSPNNIVQATNASIRISDRSGRLQQEVLLPDFFAEPPNQSIGGDARVIWDGLHGRWLAMEMSGDYLTYHLYLEVSDSADPLGGWSVYSWSGPDLFDFPAIGLSSDKVVVSANLYYRDGPNFTYSGAKLYVVDAATLLGEPAELPWTDLNTTWAGWFDFRPTVGLAPGSDLPITVGRILGSTLDVGFAKLTGTIEAGDVALSSIEDLTTSEAVLPFVAPPTPTAFAGASVSPIDGRPLDAVAQNGEMWFVSGTACEPSGDVTTRSCVRIAEVRTDTSTPTVIQDFLVGKAGYDTFGGGIGLTVSGSLVAVWSQSSAAFVGPISTYASYRLSTDPPDSLRTPVLVQAGAGVYTGERWGDYVGVAQDPSDPRSVWVAAEVSTASGDWATQVFRVSQAEQTAPAAPSRPNAAPGNASAQVSWAAPASDGGSPILQYTATASPGGQACTSAGLSCTVAGLANGTAYTFTVTASNAIGTGPASTPSSAVTPAAPPPAVTGATYVPVAPSRLLDTRVGNGLSGPLGSGVSRTFQVSGRGGVPANAVAVTGNLTVTQQTRAGYLALGPVATDSPTTSTLNFPLADARANGVTVPLGSGGKLSAVYITGRAGDRTAAIFDVTGYFVR